MKNIYSTSSENIEKAVALLKSGGVVAVPTETVYGLAGIGNNNTAIANIYEIKNRPTFNPLIAHCSDIKMIEYIAHLNDTAKKVLNEFPNGNITIVLLRKKDTDLSSLGCAGLDTVAVRIPNNKTTTDIIAKCGVPLFAPSANKSGHISPTKAEHVYKSLGEKVEMIIDGGKCECGLESTILDLTNEPTLLRAGVITKQQLENVIGTAVGEKTFARGNNPIAPGQLKSHYKPTKPLHINIEKPSDNQFYIGYGDVDCSFNLSVKGDLIEMAGNLFDALHSADESELSEIAIAPIPNEGIGVAINDKLERASTK
ncbi:MAG: L-threonylcarbamoyladenylate synthase [Alphaproteobacteria bacterium]